MNSLLNRKTFDRKTFEKPPAVYRPVPFYSWNEWMEPEELRRQVDLIASAGWGGAFVHSRIGLTTPYLGKEWYAAVDATIEQCKKRRLKVWLYDEDKWPSGYNGGTVPLADKSFRLQALIARHESMDTPADCIAVGGPQEGLRHYIWTAPLGHDWFNGTCYAGLMHRGAMERFLQDAYRSYYKRYKEYYGNVIAGEFTDEPSAIFRMRIPHGAVPYTPELLARFVQRWGYDPVPCLYLLYLDKKGAARFRLHYFRIVNELFEQNFTRQLGEWCAEHNIALTGHFMCEDSLYAQQAWGVKIMPNYRHQQVPGVDHLGRHVGNLITLKQCQSVVNQYEKPRMLSELYGVAGGGLSFEDRHWIGSQQMCFGVNLLNPHLSLYTMAGCRKRDYPQNIFYQQPWWPLNRVVDDPLSRVCAALSQGRYLAEALILHPGESTFTHWQSRLDPEKCEGLMDKEHEPATPRAKDRIGKLDTQIKSVMAKLLASQRTFDLGDETIIADDGSVDKSADSARFRINKVAYRVVILPSMTTIAPSTVSLLEEFLEAGGTVFRCGEAAKWIDGETDSRLKEFYSKIPEVALEDLARRLRKSLRPAVEVRGAKESEKEKLFVHVRDLEEGERLVFLTNLSRFRDFTARVCFNDDFQAAFLQDTSTGAEKKIVSESDEKLEILLPFHRTESHLLRLSRKKDRRKGGRAVTGKQVEQKRLDPSRWTVERLDDNAVTLDYAYWKSGGEDFSSRAVPVIGIQQYLNSCAYDGPLTLSYPVRVDGLNADRKIHLVLEYPERYRIRVNGKRVVYEGLPAWRDFRWMPIDVTGLLSDGENRIELECSKFTHGDLGSIHDSFARYGTEIEAVYLVGDFNVSATILPDKPVAEHWERFALPPVEVSVLQGDSIVLKEPKPLTPGDATVQGLPFYAGRLRLHCRFPRVNGRGVWYLRLRNLDCPVAEVRINQKKVGDIHRHPLEIALPTEIKEGSTEVELTLYGTLRNLLGPHHNTSGEMAQVSPNSFSAPPEWNDQDQNVWVLSHEKGKNIPHWTDTYCMVSFGALGEIELIRREL